MQIGPRITIRGVPDLTKGLRETLNGAVTNTRTEVANETGDLFAGLANWFTAKISPPGTVPPKNVPVTAQRVGQVQQLLVWLLVGLVVVVLAAVWLRRR